MLFKMVAVLLVGVFVGLISYMKFYVMPNQGLNGGLYKNQLSIKELPKNAIILDVRTPLEHKELALRQPHLFEQLDKLNAKEFMKTHKLGDKQDLYILCRTGKRATKAAMAFEAAGMKNVSIIKGGIEEAQIDGAEVVKTEVFSMERQVRLAAGILVALGILLGIFISQWFYLLPLFVGMGLISAGITNWCGIAMILAKMPWNN